MYISLVFLKDKYNLKMNDKDTRYNLVVMCNINTGINIVNE